MNRGANCRPIARDGRSERAPELPYARNEDLPKAVRDHLPAHAQDIFRAAFNSAWSMQAASNPRRRKETARRIAWAAVKRRYRKRGDVWMEIDG